jgi:hypothetical protein
MGKSLSDRAKLADYLSKCIAANVEVHLSPELTRIALKELRAYAAMASKKLPSGTRIAELQ